MTSQTLNIDILHKSVGKKVKNNHGEMLGEISDMTRNKEDNHIEYVIIRSGEFFGRDDRFFAVPASSKYIKISEAGRIVLQLEKDDLQFAKGIAANKCPKPNLKFGQSIYELYKYTSADQMAESK